MSLVPFQIPPHPGPISLSQARVDLPPSEFRLRLRKHLLDHPGLTLAQVAKDLKLTRQRVGSLVGRLNRPRHFAVKWEQARAKMVELRARVVGGESAEHAAEGLGISLAAARKLGLRVKSIRPAHGTLERGALGCGCWRCKKAQGLATPRGPRMDDAQKAAVLDLLAYNDPDTGEVLTQKQIAGLLGTNQNTVSRISRSAQ